METEFSYTDPINQMDQDNNIIAPFDSVPELDHHHHHQHVHNIGSNNNMNTLINNVQEHQQQEEFNISNKPEEKFLSSTDFSNAVNPSEWDTLVSRGTGKQVMDSRWDRESLYQRFDPLISTPKFNVVEEKPSNDVMEQSNIMDRTIVISSEQDCEQNLEHGKYEENMFITNNDQVFDNKNHQNEQVPNISSNSNFAEQVEETFIPSTDFSNAVNPSEWDLLVSCGTGSQAVDSRWDRESLYQSFDPLIFQKKKPQPIKPQLDKIASLKEQIRRDEFAFSSSITSSAIDGKLISIDTPSPNKNRARMTMRAATEIQDESQNTTKFSEPLPENSSEKEDTGIENYNALSDEQEINRLKESLDLQSKNFQNQLHNRGIQLKQLQSTITAAAKKLEDQQQSNRVLKEYEKSIGNFEAEIETLSRQIMKGEEERIKIAQERDYALDDLRQAEYAFSDLHSKYEQVKGAVSNFKKNEEILLKRYDEMKMKLENRDAKLKCLQGTVEDIFGKMKNDYESTIKSEEMENQRIRAQVKKLEFRMATCEKDLKQKEKENAQLGLLCDDLIKGQGK